MSAAYLTYITRGNHIIAEVTAEPIPRNLNMLGVDLVLAATWIVVASFQTMPHYHEGVETKSCVYNYLIKREDKISTSKIFDENVIKLENVLLLTELSSKQM